MVDNYETLVLAAYTPCPMAGIASPGLRAESLPARTRSLSDHLPRPWLFPLAVFAATWVLIAATWNIADAIYGRHQSWVYYFRFKDANFYLIIAEHGYQLAWPVRAAFFPLLPALVRTVSYATVFAGSNRFLWAGLIAQVLSGAAAAVAVWALAARVRDRWTADRAVLLFCAFPGAMTFGMLYTEPLGIALAAACLLAAIDRRWLLAGVLGMLAVTDHSTMIILIPVLGVTALHAIWTRRDWRSLIAPVLTPLGVLAYFAWLGLRYHDFFLWFHAEKKGWHAGIDWGAHDLRMAFWSPVATQNTFFNAQVTIIFAAAVIGVAMMFAARLPLPVSLYTVGLLVLVVISQEADKPRFIWILSGIFIGAAAKLPRWLFWPVLIASAGLLAFMVGWWPNDLPGPAP